MNLEELQAARDRERQTDKLQQLRESFYADAGEFIQQLRTERDRAAERADDPFDAPEVNQLTDEINTAEQTVEAIYEKRVGKIVKAASFAAADLPAEADGMTAEEQELFETLVDDIKTNRQRVLDILAGEEPEPSGQEATSPEPDVSAADLMGTGTDSGTADTAGPGPTQQSASGTTSSDDRERAPPEPAPGEHPPTEQEPTPEKRSEPDSVGTTTHQGDAVRNDGGQIATETAGTADPSPGSTADSETAGINRQTVRITDDISTFVGSDDRDYDLERDDIVTLPEHNASLLIERDAAEQL